MAETARISEKSDAIIQDMVELTGKPKIEIIEDALVTYKHHERMRLLNESFENLEGTLDDGF
ncbi:MAG: hypothetical protein K940chlam3_01328 [Chlamydiae bacterium]|nr:hypothetical protein [Chlamydiota bacterium]